MKLPLAQSKGKEIVIGCTYICILCSRFYDKDEYHLYAPSIPTRYNFCLKSIIKQDILIYLDYY
jgi:hypothetical protein